MMPSLAGDIQSTAPGVRAGPPGAPPFPRLTPRAPATEEEATRGHRLPPNRVHQRIPASAKNARLAKLAEQIRQLHDRGCSPLPRYPSGLPELDAALGGGFAAGAIHELIAVQDGAPVDTVALRVATQAAGSGRWILYVDSRLDLYPPGVAQLGVPLGRLLVVRAPATLDALWVCEQALRCGAIAAVVLPVRTLDALASRRLQLAAEAGGGLGLLIRADAGGGPSFAETRVQLDPLVSDPGLRRMRVSVLKLRDGRPGEPFVVEWPDATNSVPVRTVPVHRTCAARLCASG